MSAICDAFTCLPDEAERQHWPTVQAIMEHRTARRVADLMHSEDGGAGVFSEAPALLHWNNILLYGEDMALRMMANIEDEDED